MALTHKQQAFINEYLLCWNATEAARRAGYSEKTAYSIGHNLLKKVEISNEIQRRLRENTMSADEVLSRLSEQARGDIGDFVTLDSSVEMAQHSHSRLVKKFKRTIRTTKDGDVIDTVEVELYDAQSALEKLGKYHSLFTDRVQVDDWRSQAIADIRAGNIAYEALAGAFDDDLATELFAAAGVSVSVAESAG